MIGFSGPIALLVTLTCDIHCLDGTVCNRFAWMLVDLCIAAIFRPGVIRTVIRTANTLPELLVGRCEVHIVLG